MLSAFPLYDEIKRMAKLDLLIWNASSRKSNERHIFEFRAKKEVLVVEKTENLVFLLSEMCIANNFAGKIYGPKHGPCFLFTGNRSFTSSNISPQNSFHRPKSKIGVFPFGETVPMAKCWFWAQMLPFVSPWGDLALTHLPTQQHTLHWQTR